MITFEQAIEIIRNNVVALDSERAALRECLNRVLQEDVVSDIDMPPFDKSAVDGYACRQEDIRDSLNVIETIPAGIEPQRRIEKNQCAKIMTGAVMPAGADCVLLREEVEEEGDQRIRFKRDKTAVNICYKGEDVVAGQKLVSVGTRIAPSHIATLALAGCANPLVSKKANIGILATGDELVEPSVKPGQSKIRNSNSYQLLSHAQQFGCNPTYYGIVKDSNEFILGTIKKAQEANDVLLITGGVSAGDLDLVPPLLEKAGFQILFHGVGIQPGRPTVFAKSGPKYVFGIPGNPVASFIMFEVLVKELLAGLMGLAEYVKISRCSLACDVKRQKTNRLGLRPVTITPDGQAYPLEYHGTAHITSYTSADGIISIPIGVAELKAKSFVNVRIL